MGSDWEPSAAVRSTSTACKLFWSVVSFPTDIYFCKKLNLSNRMGHLSLLAIFVRDEMYQQKVCRKLE